MPDWKRFREAIQAGNPIRKQLEDIHQVEAWLELPADNAVAAMRQEIGWPTEVDEDRARLFSNTLSVVRLKLQRDAGIPFGPQAQSRMQELFVAVDEKRASEAQRRFAQRMIVSWQLSQALVEAYPSLAPSVLPAALEDIHQVEAWLELLADNAVAAMRQEIGWPTEVDEDRARLFYNTLSVVRLKLQREVGIPLGPQAQSRMQELFVAVDEKRASEVQRRFAQRMIVSWQLSQALVEAYPSLAVSPAALAQSKLRQDISEIFAQVEAVPPTAIVPGSVTPAHLTELKRILSEYSKLKAATAADNLALPELYWQMGDAARMLANACVLLGRNGDGCQWYGQAAEWFEKSGSASNVADCRKRAEDLELRLAGNLDRPTERTLKNLTAETAAPDPLAQAASLVELVNLRLSVDDFLEAGRYAEEAAAALGSAKFTDPLLVGLDAAFDGWIAAASSTGVAFEARLHQVLTLYAAILGARCSASPRQNPERTDQAYKILRASDPLLEQIAAEAKAANVEIEQQWAVYFPKAAATPAEPTPAEPSAQQQMMALDDELLKLREECNHRNDTGEPREDLIERAIELQSRAVALGMPLYEAKACLERAYVLAHLGRSAELLGAAQQAQTVLLAGRPATLASLGQTVERALYLEALTRQAMAQVMSGDFAASFATCEETIRDVERMRYHVNSPFQQSAFLGQVKFFYSIGAFTAFKLERWDAMLKCMELLKARATIRSPLTGDHLDESVTGLEQKLRETSNALDHARASGAADNDLATRRRWLRDMLEMARARSGKARDLTRDLCLVNIQATLAADEAALSYFWLNDTTILVLLIDSAHFHAERIPLKPEQRRQLDQFLATIQQLSAASVKGSPSPCHGLDGVVARLGAVLFPGFCHDFVAGKKRLILSPNQGLHLFPFHAARWEGLRDDFLGMRFAVRYVPNLSSLLLPWTGRSEGRVLAIGVPDCGVPGYIRLDNVAAEVDEVRQCYAARGIPVDVMVGSDATRERVEQMRAEGKLQSYRCVHLATHGISVFESPDEPMESRLLLYQSQLDSMDIAELEIPAEIAVLSACNSGQRAFARGTQELAGDDVFGLQRALFQAGVRTVLGSLWPVETKAAQVIVAGFHRHFAAGATAEAALQSAVSEYFRDTKWRYIYYWAPFFLTSLGSMMPAYAAPLRN